MEECKIDHDRYTRLLGYFTYLYEEEKDRRDLLNSTSKIYMFAQLFVITIFGSKVIGTDKVYTLLDSQALNFEEFPYIGFIIWSSFFLCLALFISSFVCAVLVNKMRDRERLSDPEVILSSMGEYPSENMIVVKMMTDYAVASNYNHRVNNDKATLLRYSLFSFMGSILFLVIGLVGTLIFQI